MKTLMIINCIIAIVTLALTLEIVETTAVSFKKDYPNAKFNKIPVRTKIIGYIAIIIRSLVPIYNIIILCGILFMRDTLIDKGYEKFMDRVIED